MMSVTFSKIAINNSREIAVNQRLNDSLILIGLLGLFQLASGTNQLLAGFQCQLV